MSSRELFFHAACFDGAVSCLVASEYFDAVCQSPTNLRPVDYDVRATWLSQRLPVGSAVVDFLFHPDADFWADHHPTSFLTPEAEGRFLRVPKPDWLYDPAARSCAGLLYRWLARERQHRNPHFEDLVGWAERIDSADYDTVGDAVFPVHPAPAVSQSFAVRPAPEYSVRIVQLLRRLQGDIAAVALEGDVREAIDEVQQRTRSGMELFEGATEQRTDGIVVFDVSEGNALISRYAPYVVAPTARYSVGIVRRHGEAKITAMRNPWKDFPSVDLGKLCALFGGGGHPRVGSILLRGPDTLYGKRIVEAIATSISEAESGRVLSAFDQGA